MGLMDIIKENVAKTIVSYLKNVENDIIKNAEFKINRIKRKIIKDFISISIILIAFFFLAVSITFLFIEYFHLSKTISFGIMGLVLMIIGIIIRLIR